MSIKVIRTHFVNNVNLYDIIDINDTLSHTYVNATDTVRVSTAMERVLINANIVSRLLYLKHIIYHFDHLIIDIK